MANYEQITNEETIGSLQERFKNKLVKDANPLGDGNWRYWRKQNGMDGFGIAFGIGESSSKNPEGKDRYWNAFYQTEKDTRGGTSTGVLFEINFSKNPLKVGKGKGPNSIFLKKDEKVFIGHTGLFNSHKHIGNNLIEKWKKEKGEIANVDENEFLVLCELSPDDTKIVDSISKLIEDVKKLSKLGKENSRADAESPAEQVSSQPGFAPLNTILYGPPGTGKTYSTRKKAVSIINGESHE